MKIHELDECFLHNLGKLPTTYEFSLTFLVLQQLDSHLVDFLDDVCFYNFFLNFCHFVP